MIRLKPFVDININCPKCAAAVQPNKWLITGMHSMCGITCPSCGNIMYMELPVNSGLFYPGILDAATGERCDHLPMNNWYLSGLVTAFKNRGSEEVKIEVIGSTVLGAKPVLLLNTIDATYGHALYQLLNADYYLQQKEYDLVILIQRSMLWLAPEGAAQLWVADISFGQGDKWFDALAENIELLLSGINDVFLCRSFQQADSNDFNIERYTKIAPFPLEEWNVRLVKPTVTFIWRTDRFWRRTLPKLIDNRITRKLFPGLLNTARNYFQFRWILKFSAAVRKEIPDIDFAIAGMDKRTPPLPDWIKDYRYPVHEDHTAREQAKRYAESHMVLGCNGSSLLLPGCMAGGVLDIVPGDQWAVSAGTFPFRITSIGDTHFRYVMLPCEITIERLVAVLVSVLRDRAYVEIQTSPPWREHKADLDNFAWSRYRQAAFQLSEHFSSDKGMISVSRSK